MFLSFLLRFHVNLRTEVVKAISQKVCFLRVDAGGYFLLPESI